MVSILLKSKWLLSGFTSYHRVNGCYEVVYIRASGCYLVASLICSEVHVSHAVSKLHAFHVVGRIRVGGICAAVKVVDSSLSGGSIVGKSCGFLIVSLSKDLSPCFLCSDQYLKYRMPRGFPLANSLQLD